MYPISVRVSYKCDIDEKPHTVEGEKKTRTPRTSLCTVQKATFGLEALFGKAAKD